MGRAWWALSLRVRFRRAHGRTAPEDRSSSAHRQFIRSGDPRSPRTIRGPANEQSRTDGRGPAIRRSTVLHHHYASDNTGLRSPCKTRRSEAEIAQQGFRFWATKLSARAPCERASGWWLAHRELYRAEPRAAHDVECQRALRRYAGELAV